MKRERFVGFLSTAVILTPTLANIWTSLNKTVNGRLHLSTPFALPCFSLYNGQPHIVDPGLCSDVREHYTSPSVRSNLFGAYMNLQDEFCFSNTSDQCILDNTISPALPPSPDKSCSQGSIPSYYIKVEEGSDVIAALDFTKKNSIPISIRNSGHDYMTRASQKGSLAIWMHGLRNMTYHPAFVQTNCGNRASNPAISIGAGVNFDDVYTFAESQNVTFIGGYGSTIGPSGGWVQGGGHSVLSPVYGLGVDRVLEFKVITADGILRIANSCQNTDLFWALRGGGGATFGIVLESTHKVERRMSISVASISIPKTVDRQLKLEWLSLLVNSSLLWAKEGWGGHLGSTQLRYMNPLLTLEQATASMSEIARFAVENNGTSQIETVPSWYDIYRKYVIPSQAPVGLTQTIHSRLIPTSLFSDAEGRAKLVTHLSQLLDAGIDPYVPVGPPFLYKGNSHETSVSPAWRTSIWHLGGILEIPWNSTYAERLDLAIKTTNLTLLAEKLTGYGLEGGAYLNEANLFTHRWKEAWWGVKNYQRLLEIKKKFDPGNLLKCWKCVGFEDEADMDSGRFRCMSVIQKYVDKAFQDIEIE